MVFAIEKRIFIVSEYFMTKPLKHLQQRFSDEFLEKNVPDKKYILCLLKKLIERGIV